MFLACNLVNYYKIVVSWEKLFHFIFTKLKCCFICRGNSEMTPPTVLLLIT